jgi:hypothetical protein
MVMVLVSKAKDPRQLSSYVKHILPEAVELGSCLLALGIVEIQDTFIKFYYEAVRKMQPAQYFLISLRELIRETRKHLFTVNKGGGDPFLRKIIVTLLRLIKNICEGHHYNSQLFLHDQTTSFNVDLVTELANLLYAVCDQISKTFVYVENEHFTEKMAP